MQPATEQPYLYIFAKGEMADRTRLFAWEDTPVGPISSWPPSLLITVNQILDSSFPMFIWWGDDFIQFYNDAYLEILGDDNDSKHPKALGQKGEECWQEIWGLIYPLLGQVLITAQPLYLEDQLIPIYRKGILDQVYWTFSYNIIRNNSGEAGGILVICSETTKKMVFQQEIVNQLTDSNLRFESLINEATVGKEEEQRKNDFINMVSHELKTPITSLSAYLQLLEIKAKKKDDTFISIAVEKAIIQVKKMTALINGFLNISRLESGKIQIDREKFDMAVLLQEIEDEFTATISSHIIKVTTPCENMVYADREKISQVINNFITNAIKYSPAGTAVEVSCVMVDDMFQVSVKDEGTGISDNEKDKVFERFYRAATAVSGLVSGFGIGLYLCAEIIQRHQGQIWVENNLPGKGSVFYFRLPAYT